MSPAVTSPAGRLAAAASSQLGLVTRRQAIRDLGCSDKVLASLCRSGQLARVRRGVYRFTAVPVSFEQQALAACLATSTAVASSLTAVRLYGFEPEAAGRRRRHSAPIHVSALYGREQPAQPGVRVHHARSLLSGERQARRGVPVTSPVRTLKDAAAVLRPAALEDFIAHLLATRLVLASDLSKLHAELCTRSGSGRAGSARLRRALELAGFAGSESVLEQRVLRLLRQASLPDPVQQYSVFDADGRFVARLDCAYPDVKVAVEVDGYRWHAAPGVFSSDRRRGNRLELLGWTVLRVTAAEVSDGLSELVSQLWKLLGQSGGSPTIASPRPTRYVRGHLSTSLQERVPWQISSLSPSPGAQRAAGPAGASGATAGSRRSSMATASTRSRCPSTPVRYASP